MRSRRRKRRLHEPPECNSTFYPNQGAVADWVKGMQTALAQRPDLIELEDAPDPRQLQPQIAAAKRSGIPVLVTHFYDAKDPSPPACAGCAAGVSALVRAPLSSAAAAMADWMISNSHGTADALVVTLNGLYPIPGMVNAMRHEFATKCPTSCKLKVLYIDISQLGSGPIQSVSTALAQDPGINYVNPMFDVMIAGTYAAAQSSNRADSIKMLSYNGSAFALKDVGSASTSRVFMDVAEPDEWIGYANMDQAFRLLAGMTPATEVTPIRVYDTTNIVSAGGPPNYSSGYGDAFVNGFLKLWGLTGG